MSEGTRITRTVDTDLDVDELWDLVADGEAWAAGWSTRPTSTWRPGRPARSSTTASSGRVRIDQRRRLAGGVHVVAARPGPSWCRPSSCVVLPAAAGSRLHVTETSLSARPVVGSARRLGRADDAARGPGARRLRVSDDAAPTDDRSTSCSPSSPTRPAAPCSSASSTTARRPPRRSPTTSRRPARRSSSTCACSPTPGSSCPSATGARCATSPRPSASPTPSTGCSTPAGRWDRRLGRLRAERLTSIADRAATGERRAPTQPAAAARPAAMSAAIGAAAGARAGRGPRPVAVAVGPAEVTPRAPANAASISPAFGDGWRPASTTRPARRPASGSGGGRRRAPRRRRPGRRWRRRRGGPPAHPKRA